jgi:hypothetical protein
MKRAVQEAATKWLVAQDKIRRLQVRFEEINKELGELPLGSERRLVDLLKESWQIEADLAMMDDEQAAVEKVITE